MLLEVIERKPNGTRNLAKLELDVLDLFGQFSKALGYPKSIGEIYGILYLADGAMSMGEIVDKMGLSLGSVSQGLKVLKVLNAISVRHSDSARKDLFTAKTDFGHFLVCFLNDRVQPGVQALRDAIERIRSQASRDLACGPGVVQRLDGIEGIYTLLAQVVPAVKVVLETPK